MSSNTLIRSLFSTSSLVPISQNLSICIDLFVQEIKRRKLKYIIAVTAPAGFPDHPHRGFETVTYMLQVFMVLILFSPLEITTL